MARCIEMTETDTQPEARILLGVLGLGHVGLPTALSFAQLGWNVIGADDDASKARRIAAGETPFFEPGMQEELRRQLDAGRFSVALDPPEAIQAADVLFVCVGTPQNDDGSADLSQIERAARCIAENMNGYKLIVEKSTTPVRTAEELQRTIREHAGTGSEFDVAVNPEFLREGTAMDDSMHPERVVLGVETDRARQLLTLIYQPLVDQLEGGTHRIVVTDLNTAEIIKHASNAFLAMKVSFINLVAMLCEATGADVENVAAALRMDRRIGASHLHAGVGFGGYCLPKDLRALSHVGEELGVDMSLLRAVSAINDRQVAATVDKVRAAVGDLKGRTVAVWGVAFKPGTDDVREAPSIPIINALMTQGALLRIYDPAAMEEFEAALGAASKVIIYCRTALEAIAQADVLLLLTEWPEFRGVDLRRVKAAMRGKAIVDGRNALDPARARTLDFTYQGFGR